MTPGKRALCIGILILLGSNLLAQDEPIITSKSPDFSTVDRHFSLTDTLFIKVYRPEINFIDLAEMSYFLKPRQSDLGFDGLFRNNMDGSYTAAIGLANADTSFFEWELWVQLKDNAGHGFRANLSILIGEKNEQWRPPTFEFRGHITAVHGDSIRVRDVWFEINRNTRILNEREWELSISDLVVGLQAYVRAERRQDGRAFAHLMKVDLTSLREGKLVVKGVLTHLDSAAFSLDGLRLEVDDKTEIHNRDHALTLDSLETGLLVEVEALFQPDTTLLARQVFVIDNAKREEEFEITGQVGVINDSLLVVAGFEFKLDEYTHYKGPEGLPLRQDMLEIGALVTVRGEFRADSLLWANWVKIEDLPGTVFEDAGEIESLRDSTITVNNALFHLNEATRIFGPYRNPIQFVDLKVGMRVGLHAFRDEAGNNWALKIGVIGEAREHVRVAGRIEEIGEATLTVHHVIFKVDSTTEMRGNDGDDVDLESLAVGTPVRIDGVRTPGQQALALTIEVGMLHGEEMHIAGPVEKIEMDTLLVAGIHFLLTERTNVFGPGRIRVHADSIKVNQMVFVNGRRLPDGTALALRIRLRVDEDRHIRVHGNVTAVGSDNISIEGHTFAVTDSTEYSDREENALRLTDFAEGDLVSALAVHDSTGTFLLKLRLEEAAELAGEVSEAETSGLSKSENQSFILLGTTILVDDNTLIVDGNNNDVEIEAIAAGAVVEVRGTLTNDNEVLATTITVVEEALTSGVEKAQNNIPLAFSLKQNYPNPFNPSTNIDYELTGNKFLGVILRIYNVAGQEVNTLVHARQSPGSYTVQWNGRNARGQIVASGIYFVHLRVGPQIQVRRMILNK